MNVYETDKQYVAHTYKRFPICIKSGKGSVATDENGKKYIDLSTGIGVDSFGYADDEWIAAVTTQLNLIQHASNLYHTEPCARLAKMLAEKTGMKKVFFCNSGAEANENGIKVVRKYAAERKGSDYYTIITLENSFHGRTLTTLAAAGQEELHSLYQPLPEGFVHIPANDIDALEKAVKEYRVAGIMVECIQGEGGVMALDTDFVKAIYDICRKEDILFMCDEVQSGNGRSGYLYSYMYYGVEPDVVATAKGLGGGLPIGATLIGERAENVFSYGDTGSTFGGNPVVCAGACSILERIDDKLLAEVREKSAYLFDVFGKAEGIEEVSGLGLMIGLKTTRPVGELVPKIMEKGVLCITAKNKLRLLPALNIPMDLLKEAADVIISVCGEQGGE